ncbi:hypothetical protein [Desulfotomaculum copahuensis]|uniref:hypothetical protein n=1 Tax=Desulfotomaculum copahuensis TaxID=1838280 RepID=UPI000B059578|nr:hypothetical protein [Desulfotomaculum copahuensis]
MAGVLLAAVANDLLLDALRRAAEQPLVVFGTMDGKTLGSMSGGEGVYFYECD